MTQGFLYLSRADVEQVNLPMGEVLEAVEAAFLEKGLGRVEMPPKIGIHPTAVGYLHAMPAQVPSVRATGIKWISNFGENPAHGLPTISGLLILNHPLTGFPIAVMDATWITAKRTGAASAIAAKYLARGDAGRLAIIGCGVQGQSHLEAMRAQFPSIRQVVAYDRRSETLARYVREMEALAAVPIASASDCRSAVEGADIVVTATEILKQPNPVIRPEWIAPGSFCMSIDCDAQFTREAICAMDLLCTDDVAQVSHYRTMGYFGSTPDPQAELGDIVAGKRPGRTDPAQRIMALHLGLATEDMVTATRVLEQAQARGIGRRLPL